MPASGYCLADLHIHSALSPCADDRMTPAAVTAQARRVGLDIMALTDHNSVRNCLAFLNWDSPDLWIIPGMELQTREGVHLICLFPGMAAAWEWQDFVDRHLPDLPNRSERFGHQYLFNAAGEVTGEEHRLLLNSTTLAWDEVLQRVPEYGGLVYPAHIDRPSFSVLANLNRIPEERSLRIVEISAQADPARLTRDYPHLAGARLIRSSDAHRLDEVGRVCTKLRVAIREWDALQSALTSPIPETGG